MAGRTPKNYIGGSSITKNWRYGDQAPTSWRQTADILGSAQRRQRRESASFVTDPFIKKIADFIHQNATVKPPE